MFDLSKLGLTCGAAALAASALVASPAAAQEAAPAINNGAVSFSLGVDVPTKYIFRGYELQEDGLIVQPYVEASFSVYEDVDFYVGLWNSLHSDDVFEGASGGLIEESNNDGWFESDFYAGVSLGMFDPISIDISYVGYYYPSTTNDVIGDYREIDIAVAYDDSDLWGGDFTLSPYALIAFEVDTNGEGDDENIYLEFGAETGFTVFESEDYPIDLTVPVTIGLSLDEFYVDDDGDNEFFGFISIGANFGMPLTFIPAEYGAWSAGAGLTLFILNDNAAGLEDGDSEEFNIVGTVGIALEY